MPVYLVTDGRLEQSAHEAFEIAWNFLSCSREIADTAVAQTFIATEIMRLLDRGERNKIRLANLSIRAFQATWPIERHARRKLANA